MSPAEIQALTTLLAPHLISVALISTRLLPVALLCPWLGGQLAPSQVKLGLVVSLALCLHGAGGIAVVEVPTAWGFSALALREAVFGVSLGLIAALPADAARMGGRFIDLFRGASAEAFNPASGTRESAVGEALYQLVVALGAMGVALPMVLGGLWHSFSMVKLGAYVPTEAGALQVAALAGTAMGTGLAVGAPIAGVALATDCLMGLIARAAPQLNIQDTGAPLKLLGGGAVLWLTLGLLVERLMGDVATSTGAFARLLHG